LCGVEMGLSLADVPIRRGGVQAALDYLAAPTQDGIKPPGAAAQLV